jgi:hypothetical protein
MEKNALKAGVKLPSVQQHAAGFYAGAEGGDYGLQDDECDDDDEDDDDDDDEFDEDDDENENGN